MSQYKMFRNYLMNELGITKNDIQRWTEEAIREEAVSKVSIENLSRLLDQRLDTWDFRNQCKGAIAEKLASRITLELKEESTNE